MPKTKTSYVCTQCGAVQPKWMGKCPDCGSWNTLIEQVEEPVSRFSAAAGGGRSPASVALASSLEEIDSSEEQRYLTGMGELNRVLGGGIVPGSVVLLSGDPGIGKSTLLLQICQTISSGARILYVSGEESLRQIKLRAARLGVTTQNLALSSTTDIEAVVELIRREKPDIVMVDSIQTMNLSALNSSSGSVTQVRECTQLLINLAKSMEVPVFIVGHVNKDGAIAGPKVLEHMVDAVLYFEGDRQHEYRLLRAVKNRFGSVNELGVFEMRAEGMVPVTNPSESLLSQRARGISGSVVLCTLQGSRPILCDLQALASRSFYTVPKRTVGGMDSGRVALLLAVMEKRAGKKLFDQDVYINVAGGLALSDPAADLAVCVAVASSLMGFTLSPTLSVMGEVGLCGEVRPVAQAERRVAECVRLGFTDILLPRQNLKRLRPIDGVRMTGVDTLMQALAVVG